MKIGKLNSQIQDNRIAETGSKIVVLSFKNWRIASMILLLATLVIGCKLKPGRGDILSVNDMKLVMWDMMVADEFTTTYLPRDTIFKGKKDSANLVKKGVNKFYQEVFALHKVNQTKFFGSYDFYKTHPEYYKILMDSLSAYGNRERESRFMKTKSTPQPVKLPKDLPKRLPKDSLVE